MERTWRTDLLLGLFLVAVGVVAGWALQAKVEEPAERARDVALAEIAWLRDLIRECDAARAATEAELAPLRAQVDEAEDDYLNGNVDAATAKARQTRRDLPDGCPKLPPLLDVPGLQE